MADITLLVCTERCLEGCSFSQTDTAASPQSLDQAPQRTVAANWSLPPPRWRWRLLPSPSLTRSDSQEGCCLPASQQCILMGI